MKSLRRLMKLVLGSTAFCMVLSISGQCSGQGLTVQQPVIRFFNVGTVVSVPDGGTISLGGVSSSSQGAVTRGVPGLSGIPGVNRLFNNRAIGSEDSRSTASVTTRILIMSELEEKVLAEAAQLEAADLARARAAGLTVPEDVQRKAEFMTRSIRGGRKR